MKRLKDEFVFRISKSVNLVDSQVLEVGCGPGTRSEALARSCKKLIGIDPDRSMIDLAKQKNVSNAEFKQGNAQKLDFADHSFEVVVFTLSFHHVPADDMSRVIGEALRVIKPGGFIVFLEPGTEGSFFEAEIKFDASDGDECEEKQIAYRAMMEDPRMRLIEEISDDETVLRFDSVEDFVQTMQPKKNHADLAGFLERNNYILMAKRRINIFQSSL